MLAAGGAGGGGGGGSSWAATGTISCGPGCAVTMGTSALAPGPGGGRSVTAGCLLLCDDQVPGVAGQPGGLSLQWGYTAPGPPSSNAACAPAVVPLPGTVEGTEVVDLAGASGSAGGLPAAGSGTSGGPGGQGAVLDLTVQGKGLSLVAVVGCNGAGPVGGPGFFPGASSGGQQAVCTASASGSVSCTVDGQGGGGGGASALCVLGQGQGPSSCTPTNPALAFCPLSLSGPPAETCLLAVAGGGGGGGAASVETTNGLVGSACSALVAGNGGLPSGATSTPSGTPAVADGGSAAGSLGAGQSGAGGGGTASQALGGYPEAFGSSGSPFGYATPSSPGNGSWAPATGDPAAGGGGGGGYNTGVGGTATSACGGGGGSSAFVAPSRSGILLAVTSGGTNPGTGYVQVGGLGSRLIAELPAGDDPSVTVGSTFSATG
ncbi:hypothetical protein Acit_09980 [Aciditerrimonas ferrireducens]|nr:hypothetical protein [Aciditerrimonas ferrireducens]